jgi:HEAT repeat protein
VSRRRSLEDVLSDLRRLRAEPGAPEAVPRLREALTEPSPHAVARAAGLVAELELSALVGDLEAAFDRLMKDPARSDKGCGGKAAIARALDRLETADGRTFLRGIRHVQMEPVFGGQVDTAVELRGACALALARMRHPAALTELAERLADPEAPARATAARALGELGREEGGALLRLRARIGDEPSVMLECLTALLRLSPAPSLSFVTGFLEAPQAEVAEAAAAALGSSRRPEALGVLREWYGRVLDGPRRRAALLAMSTLRREDALDFLLGLVREAPPERAREAIAALGIYRGDERLAGRVRDAARAREGADLLPEADRVFGALPRA